MLKALPAALIAAAVFFPSVASAKDIQIGATKTAIYAPTCPNATSTSECGVGLIEATLFESMSDKVANPTAITTPGVISSFSVGVSPLSSNATTRKTWLKSIETAYGLPEIRLTVLRRVGGAAGNNWRVAAQSPVYQLQNYLGRVVELPLINPIPVTSGEVLAITSPTWAPVVSTTVTSNPVTFSIRYDIASGNTSCNKTKGFVSPSSLFVDDLMGEVANFGCQYSTSAEYTAMEITSP